MWEPHDLATWAVHVIFGWAAMGGAIVALSTVKGSRAHKLGGRIFAVPMAIAALTAITFVGEGIGPLVYVMSAATLYLLATSVLAIRNQLAAAPWLEKALVVVPIALFAFSVVIFIRSAQAGNIGLLFGPALYAAVFLTLVVGDIRLFVNRPTESSAWIKRHLFRMLLAFAFAVRALFSIGVDVGLPFEVAVTAPIILALIATWWFQRRIDDEAASEPSGTSARTA